MHICTHLSHTHTHIRTMDERQIDVYIYMYYIHALKNSVLLFQSICIVCT